MAIHARVIRGRIREGQDDRGIQILENDVLPILEDMTGFQGCDVLVDGQLFELLTWWEQCPVGTEELDAFYQNLVEKAGEVLEGVPEHIRYVLRLHRAAGPHPSPAPED